MCVGVPMQVLTTSTFQAMCRNGDKQEMIDTALVDAALMPGDYLLVHLGRGIRKLSSDEAKAIGNALQALDNAVKGDAFDYLISDLIGREPLLPDHLRPVGKKGNAP